MSPNRRGIYREGALATQLKKFMKIISSSFTIFFVSITIVQAIPTPAPGLVDSSVNAMKSMATQELKTELWYAKLNAMIAKSESKTELATIDEVNELWNRHHENIPVELRPKVVSFRRT